MKPPYFLYVFLLFSFFVPFIPSTFAGGSSARVYETNVRDKYLISGEEDQLILSFTVESDSLAVDSLDITCAPSHGFTNLKLMHGDIELGKTVFVPAEITGNQKAHFGAINYILPIGETTELSLLATVEKNTGDFITACAIDDLFLRNTETDWTFSAEAQAIKFEGLNRLIYVDDLTVDDIVSNFNIMDSKLRPSNLAIDSNDNLLMDFNINASKGTVIEDLFIFCDGGNIIREYRLEANGISFDYRAMQNDWYTNSRPEHSSADRIVFAGIDVVTGYGEGVNFKLYGNTYNYFSHMPYREMACSVIDIKTATSPEIFEEEISMTHHWLSALFHFSQKGSLVEFLNKLKDLVGKGV